MSVPALTVNKVCLSGIDAIALADQLIRAGQFDVVVAGGQESMTRAPHMLEKSRQGLKYGDITISDHLAYDGLYDIFTDQAMGALTESHNDGAVFATREEQDAFAAASHRKAAAAWKNRLFDDEVIHVQIPQRKGDPFVVHEDEGIRADTTTESLSRLKPSFDGNGTITAGSASQISDGAAARRVGCPHYSARRAGTQAPGRRHRRSCTMWRRRPGRPPDPPRLMHGTGR